jgi:predicted RNA-binding Zn-ribbon protein involved in translation (DUF1610 family)
VYLVAEDSFRYLLPPAEGISQPLHFIPYWRLKGLTFLFQPTGIAARFTDASFLSLRHRGLPPSLGLRPQAMKLQFVTSRVSGRFLSSEPDDPGFPASAGGSGWKCRGPAAFVGETVSRIYAPFYFRDGRLYDALLKRAVPTATDLDPSAIEGAPEISPWNVSFVSTLCPSCGWDLQGEKDALVLVCRNCGSLWQCRRAGLERIPFASLADGPAPLHYLPFWRMKVRMEGLELSSLADLVRIANLPRAISPELRNTPIYFWSPAFQDQPGPVSPLGPQMNDRPAVGGIAGSSPGRHPLTR